VKALGAQMTLGRFRYWGGLLLVATISSLAPLAHADEAKDLFQRGAAAYREGEYEKAIELFGQAYRQHPYPELVYNTGQAYEKLGDTPRALQSFREYLRLAPNASDRATVEKRIGALEERQAQKGLTDVSVSSTPAGAEVLVDGRRVGKTPWAGKAKPGSHSVTLTLAGHGTVHRNVELGDRALALDLALSPSALTSATPDAAAAEPGPRVQPLTLVVLGVGVAGLGGAVGFELARRGAEDDASTSRTQVGHVKAYDRMERDQTIARILLGVGAAGVAVGGTLLYLDLNRKSGVAVGCSTACGARFASTF
jgi:tetratricopeptide (TPR) repeat protein